MACATPCWSQEAYPNRPVKFVVAFPARGAVDAVARDLAHRLSAVWSQPIVIDDKPGGNGVIAADLVAKAPPGGYTLFVNYDGVAVVMPFLAAAATSSAARSARSSTATRPCSPGAPSPRNSA